jgi:hypothetical protein
MPVGYLVGVTLLAGATTATLFPLRRPRALAMLSFRASVALNELPVVAAALLFASTALAPLSGLPWSPGGVSGHGRCSTAPSRRAWVRARETLVTPRWPPPCDTTSPGFASCSAPSSLGAATSYG